MAERRNGTPARRTTPSAAAVASLGDRAVDNGGSGQLPEWLAIDWKCYVRSNERSNDEYERQR